MGKNVCVLFECGLGSEDADTMAISEPEESPEVSKEVHAQDKEPDAVPDLKAVELALAEKLLEVGKRLHEGHPVTVHDMSQIRTLWLTLERLQPEETEAISAEDPEGIHDVDNLWMTDDMSESEETVSTQWTENKNENTDLNDACDEQFPIGEITENFSDGKSKRAKFHTSRSCAFSKFNCRDMFKFLFSLHLELSQTIRKQQGMHMK